MITHLPNALTLGNLLTGVVGIITVLTNSYELGVFFIFVAAGLDFLDGFLARILRVSGELGKQLDSLADLVSFGVLPGLILYAWCDSLSESDWLPYLCLSIPVFSAYRLAKFNLDTRQSDRFIGLPTPANALFFSTLPYLALQAKVVEQVLSNPWILVGLAGMFSYLLIAEIPLLSLKFKNFRFADNFWKYSLLIVGALMLILMGIGGFPLIIVFYLVFSLLEHTFSSP